jgi:hypothetical protein
MVMAFKLISVGSLTPLNIIDFLGEYDAKCKTALGRESRPLGLIDEKTEGRKSRFTGPLICIEDIVVTLKSTM